MASKLMLNTILFGGTNREHFVSVASAQALADALPEAANVASAITPVPGVGPMTIACLSRNTLEAAYLRRSLPMPAVDFATEIIQPCRI